MNQQINNCKIGENTKIWHYVNLYGCKIGDNCMIGSFVEIQDDVKIGNGVRVQSHSFICSKTKIEDNVFIGHGVMFINDVHPPSEKEKWQTTTIKKGAVIGTGAVLFPVTIGECAVVAAGSVVLNNVPAGAMVAGNPAVVKKYRGAEIVKNLLY